MTVEANGLRFHLVDEGDGPPVVLLHGFPDTSAVWRHQLPMLTAAGFRVIAPDMRGRGQSDRPTDVDSYGLTNIVADVTGILDALGLERAHVVGHDWGAAAAWLVASLAPQRVDRLVAISVGFPGAKRPDRRMLEQAWYRLLFLFPEAEELLRRDDWYLLRELFGDAPDAARYLVDLSEPEALTAGLNWYRANLPVSRLAASSPQLPVVAAPTLGIFGETDPYLSEGAMRASGTHVTPGRWRYEQLANTGHWPQLEQTHALNELLLEFLTA